MSKNRLLVLWLDDEHEREEFIQFKDYLSDNSIDLECYKSQRSALEALKKNASKFDAILCDIQILDSDASAKGHPAYLYPFLSGLDKLDVAFDPIIFSGQIDLDKTDVDVMLGSILKGKTILNKRESRVADKVVEAIHIKASENPVFNVKIKFNNVYTLYEKGYLDEIAILPFKEFFSNPRLNREHCNSLRQTLESLYGRLSKLGIIPQAVYSNTTEGKNAVDFLMCLPVNGIQLDSKFKINNNVRRWLADHFYDCSLGSHIPDDNYELRELFEDVGTDLHHSVVASLYRFEEIANYFNHWIPKILASEEFKNGNHVTEVTNTSESSETTNSEIAAVVTSIHPNGFGFAKSADQKTYFIPRPKVRADLMAGDRILITKIEPPTTGDYEQIVDYSILDA